MSTKWPELLSQAEARVDELCRDEHWPHRNALLCTLGSKFLAVGSPAELALIDCGDEASEIVAVHEVIFGKLPVILAGKNRIDMDEVDGSVTTQPLSTAIASDLVCIGPKAPPLELPWLADATHLNWMHEMLPFPKLPALLGRVELTVLEELHRPREAPQAHLLRQVIEGEVCGRVSDEVTVLSWIP